MKTTIQSGDAEVRADGKTTSPDLDVARKLNIARETHSRAKAAYNEAVTALAQAETEELHAFAAYSETPSLEAKQAHGNARGVVEAAKRKVAAAERDVRETAEMVQRLEAKIRRTEEAERRRELERRASLAVFYERTEKHFKALLDAEKAMRAACAAIDAEYRASSEAARKAGIRPFTAEHTKLPLRLLYAGDNPRALRWLVDHYGPSPIHKTSEDERPLSKVVLGGLDSLRPGLAPSGGDVEVVKAELEIVRSSDNEWVWRKRIRDARYERALKGATDEDALQELNDRRQNERAMRAYSHLGSVSE